MKIGKYSLLNIKGLLLVINTMWLLSIIKAENKYQEQKIISSNEKSQDGSNKNDKFITPKIVPSKDSKNTNNEKTVIYRTNTDNHLNNDNNSNRNNLPALETAKYFEYSPPRSIPSTMRMESNRNIYSSDNDNNKISNYENYEDSLSPARRIQTGRYSNSFRSEANRYDLLPQRLFPASISTRAIDIIPHPQIAAGKEY